MFNITDVKRIESIDQVSQLKEITGLKKGAYRLMIIVLKCRGRSDHTVSNLALWNNLNEKGELKSS